ncbi:hypothetical protein ACTJKH_07270 [Microbacterium sp. 22215]|uniref:YegP family protein n=1 Tax=Microbacterium sp. 22215 TaxID=3453893 RepID=UPI003F827729
MYFEVSNDAGGHPTWKLFSANHQLVAWAGESFASTFNAQRAARAFQAAASVVFYEVYLDGGGKYRWRALRGGNKVAASGEAFASRDNAERAKENVRTGAGGARGV